ncbi:bifunctional trypsin-like peptidase domain-containing/SEL1-like repeat protein [Pelodictyon luteolum]|nr:bifunctional trypsin-like peptidase domain-containing/SEL1-like repeat protein [Pelodictyon luteolum]
MKKRTAALLIVSQAVHSGGGVFWILFAILFSWPLSSLAAESKAAEVFQRVSKSVVVVHARNDSGDVLVMGSGVVLPGGTVATCHHVVSDARKITVDYAGGEYPAVVRYSDIERDICSLTVQGLKAPAVSMGSMAALAVGERVYAVGTPQGYPLTLSEGIISGFREVRGHRYMQTTAPISSGSSGGGLFDEEGLLVGMTTFFLKDAQQMNFAAPVEWLAALPEGRAGRVENKRKDEIRGIRARAELGDADAQYTLGACYSEGDGVRKDPAEAVRWYRLAARQGNADARNSLGWAYREGNGVKRDYDRALLLFRMAAEQNEQYAQNNLGLMYMNGEGVKQDNAEAFKWFCMSAAQGNGYGRCNIGEMYVKGQVVEQNYEEAMKWFRLAAEKDGNDAAYWIGWLYEEGKGVPADPDEAARWYRIAAGSTDPNGLLSIGEMYEKGLGVPGSISNAEKWYRKACRAGEKDACERLKRLAGK